ncbi:transglutaminase family protein [Sphingomonas sp. SRS2]|uniref:transglutaminase family protein n=1 Tax=Sphingomonas sp. SRS2 TaxID=133190 RepID=UPI0006184B19|nr:transglutaminase family protein [Sphingomonas sp. SRS2]KKC26581.1 transglutaminase [Sphingomonas sp. SRS2]
MTRLTIRHRTSYHYDGPVSLGPHRLMLRPRESCDLKLLSFQLRITPEASVSWAHDVLGNAVATASFTGTTDRLLIESAAELEIESVAWPVFDIAATAISFPFRYSDEEWADLGALAVQVHPDPSGRLRAWAQAFVAGNPTDTLSLLKDLSNGVAGWISYQSRETEGTQSPEQTLDRGWGSCRDFAVLFVEAARSLGFGARIISGYLHDPDGELTGNAGTGSTHAWAEVYIPGAGWITFDPTNRSVGGFNLVPVAVARDITRAMPVAGSFAGNARLGAMTVEVDVTRGGAEL